MAFLEMTGEERKTGENAKEIGERDPFMGEVSKKTGNARTIRESGKQDFVNSDCSQPEERNRQRVVVENRNPEEGECEENEIEGDPKEDERIRIGGDLSCKHGDEELPDEAGRPSAFGVGNFSSLVGSGPPG